MLRGYRSHHRRIIAVQTCDFPAFVVEIGEIDGGTNVMGVSILVAVRQASSVTLAGAVDLHFTALINNYQYLTP